MRARYLSIALFSFLLAACGAEERSPRQEGARRVTLQGTTGTSGDGFVLAGQRVVTDGQNDPNVDLYLTMTMVVSLFPATEPAGLCEMSSPDSTFTRVDDIPLDDAACPAEWGPAYLFGNSTDDASRAAGQGFLVKDRLGTTRGRLMVISDFVKDSSASQPALTEVVFDYLPEPI